MAFPVIQSSNSNAVTGASVTITKPTGLAVGDLMVALLSGTASTTTSGDTINELAGWTRVAVAGGVSGDNAYTCIQYRIADSADVAASNFTFTTPAASLRLVGAIFRITGHRPTGFAGVTAANSNNSANSTAFSQSPNITPTSIETLFLAIIHGSFFNGGATTVSGYSSTPSITWTEQYESSINLGTGDPVSAIITGQMATPSQLTNLSATFSGAQVQHRYSIIAIYPIVDGIGTNTLATNTITSFAQSGIADTLAGTVLATNTAVGHAQTGRGTAPTQWTNETKPSTNWTNESL